MKRWLVRFCVIFVMGFGVLNAMAFYHAWRMTHFFGSGSRTESPMKLGFVAKVAVLVGGVNIPRPESGPAPPAGRTVHFTTRDGVRLEAWEIPAATNRAVAVLFHGHVGTKSGLVGEAGVLHEFGVRTVLVDFRGAGGSEGMTTTLGWREATDVAAAASWARAQWPREPLILYGTSLGAAAVLRAIAIENVRPDGIIVECPFDSLLTTVSHRYHVMGLPAFPFAHLLVFWGGVQHNFNAFTFNPAAYAQAVTCPALLVDGENDPWVKPAEARRIAAAMRGPTQCCILNHTGHGGYLRDAPESYRGVLSAWLSQRLGTGQ